MILVLVTKSCVCMCDCLCVRSIPGLSRRGQYDPRTPRALRWTSRSCFPLNSLTFWSLTLLALFIPNYLNTVLTQEIEVNPDQLLILASSTLASLVTSLTILFQCHVYGAISSTCVALIFIVSHSVFTLQGSFVFILILTYSRNRGPTTTLWWTHC